MPNARNSICQDPDGAVDWGRGLEMRKTVQEFADIFVHIKRSFLYQCLVMLEAVCVRDVDNAAASIWFEVWGLWIPVQEIWVFPGKFTKNFDFFQAISPKNFDFPGRYFRMTFFPFIQTKLAIYSFFRLSRQNWPFTATSGQIILFLFKSHHFRTYFLYMIRL